LQGKIFLTGGTGSLGHALVARAEQGGWDCQFTIYSRDEVKQGEMRSRYPSHRFVLGDVRDVDWLAIAMRGHDLVIHAAAYKQVPAAEVNVAEAVETNVVGSRNVARAAVQVGVPRVLGISTDKACAPVNAYGESKALMEKLFQGACLWSGGRARFHLVRYGNVLGSRGSVVPLFKRQIERGEPVTFTDAMMTRFWLTLDDAVDLIVAALAETIPGTVLIPKCPASTMYDLAAAVAGGAEAFAKIGHRILGIRPGEKHDEQLVNAAEAMHTDDIGSHYRIHPAYSGHHGNLPTGFEYRSDTARQLTIAELGRMLNG
jgi:UDP-N-acetylglucosamine 4,6-dehydratase